ncbi:hypothetical protein H7827_18415 [Streptomyces sp. JH002]|uniref:hypothetical protein n=1 Tax=Streptomyces sp. JH002 TaxID=2763259 RepID=UPI003D805055
MTRPHAASPRDAQLAERISAREPYFLKLKQSPDAHGAIRLQCPAAGPSPSVACPRFNQVHHIAASRPAVVDLTSPRATAAHTAAKPTVPTPQGERLQPPPMEELPRICWQPTMTIHPGDLGKLDKYRQDRHYLHPAWQDAYRPIRANTEGLNGRAKGHDIDIADPRKRLAHGRVAQTILIALMICVINLNSLSAWQNTTHQTTATEPGEPTEPTGHTPELLITNGLPPPRPTRTSTNA